MSIICMGTCHRRNTRRQFVSLLHALASECLCNVNEYPTQSCLVATCRMPWSSFNSTRGLKCLLTGTTRSTSRLTPSWEPTWKRYFKISIKRSYPRKNPRWLSFANYFIFLPQVGELQLCSGTGQNSQVLPRWHRRAGPERRQRYPDSGTGVAANEKVKHHFTLSFSKSFSKKNKLTGVSRSLA